MKQIRIYVDTSVIGGCFNTEFQSWSNGPNREISGSEYFASVGCDSSLSGLRSRSCQELYSELLSFAESSSVTEEALSVLTAYESHSVIGARFRNDMLHIALATVAEVETGKPELSAYCQA